MAKEIPVYLFVGFLESGKTKFIQETFEDPNFDSGDKTLLLICEEGEEEYNEKKFALPRRDREGAGGQVRAEPPEPCKAGQGSRRRPRGHRVQRHVAAAGFSGCPARELAGVQCIATADGTTALTYARDNSMRSLMLDKIARSELIVSTAPKP